MTHRHVHVGRLQLAVREWASPNGHPSIVLVHGLASNSRLWDGAANELARLGYHVIALDQRGHGQSSKPDDGYDTPTVASDLAELIAVMELDRPVVVGQSWGGNVVIELAHQRSDLTRGVCGVDGGLIQLADRFDSWDECAKYLQPPRLAGMRSADFEGMIRSGYSGWPETAVAGTLANMQHHDDGTISPWLTFDRHMEILRGLWDHRPQEILPTLGCSVLFTPADSGDAWSSVKREEYSRALRQNEHVRVEWFSPAHHDVHAQFPERWAAVLHRYIDEGFFA
ncbi:MAG: alpha/beta fold hydrolase [Ilumatobacteraceae bacterium]